MNISKKLLPIWFFLVFLCFPNIAHTKKLLIVAPHPDDDVIAFAGVTFRAKAQGDTVKVVYMTNGDVDGTDLGLPKTI